MRTSLNWENYTEIFFNIFSPLMGVGTHQRGMAQIFVTVRLTGAKKESMSRKMSLGTSVLVRGNK